MYSVAEADVDTWVGHHGLEITLSDGTLFAHFEGHSMGQGGVKFDYCEVLQSTGVPIAYIDCLQLSAFGVQRNASIQTEFN